MLRENYANQIDELLTRYAQKRSAVLPLLYIAQDAYGYLHRDAIREVAEILELPYTDVFEVVGFYTLFYSQPVGKCVLQVCDDVPCCYLGAEELISALKQRLKIVENGTSADGLFTLQRVKCLAACDKPPVVQANLDYLYNVTVERLDAMLSDLQARIERAEALSVSGQFAEDYDLLAHGLRLIPRELGSMPGSEAAAQPAAVHEVEPAAQTSAEPQPAEERAAQAEASEVIERESPVEASADRSPAGQHAAPEGAGKPDAGAVPARAAQQEAAQPADEQLDEQAPQSGGSAGYRSDGTKASEQ